MMGGFLGEAFKTNVIEVKNVCVVEGVLVEVLVLIYSIYPISRSLGSNNIGDDGARHLAKALETNRLNDNPVSTKACGKE